MSTSLGEDKVPSKRPKDTKFKQQKLPAWQPIMTVGSVLPVLFGIGVLFVPMGVVLLITSNNVQELTIDYTTSNCKYQYDERLTCAEFVGNNSGHKCPCKISFTLPQKFVGQVYMYYGLTNFYQNHRRYVKSRDDNQLLGTQKTYSQLTTDCDPYRGVANSSLPGGGIPFAPCGAIANSLFNDSLGIEYVNKTKSTKLDLLKTDIAWTTDKQYKFRNPSGFSANPAGAFNGTAHPPNWQISVDNLNRDDPNNNGYENEDLIVWMRTAALPTFRKLYRRVNHTGMFADGLPAGNYTLHVQYAYPVTSFGGSKIMILSTTSWLGGKNPFLGIGYLVVGSICIVLSIIFLIIHLKVGKSGIELAQSVNNRTAY